MANRADQKDDACKLKYEQGCENDCWNENYCDSYSGEWEIYFLRADFSMKKLGDKIPDTSKIIARSESQILVVGDPENSTGSREYVGAIDARNENRAFIGYYEPRNERMYGVIASFNESGKIHQSGCIPCFAFDERDSYPFSEKSQKFPTNIFLCANVLVVVIQHRYSQNCFVVGAHFGTESFSFKIRTKVKLDSFCSQMKTELGRWLCISTEKTKMILAFDLLSFRKSLRQDNMLYDKAIFPWCSSLVSVLKSLPHVPSYQFKPESVLPEICVKCGNKTGIWGPGDVEVEGGKGNCLQCGLRWSKSSQRWQCAKPVEVDRCPCNAPLISATDYVCLAPHAEYKMKVHPLDQVEVQNDVWMEKKFRMMARVEYEKVTQKRAKDPDMDS